MYMCCQFLDKFYETFIECVLNRSTDDYLLFMQSVIYSLFGDIIKEVCYFLTNKQADKQHESDE